MPPTVVLNPNVIPEAKPTFLPRNVCPKTTIELYGAKRERPTGISSSVEIQTFVLLTKKNIAGTIIKKDKRKPQAVRKQAAGKRNDHAQDK